MPTFDEIIKGMEGLDKKLINELLKLSGASKAKLLDFIASGEFDEFIASTGLNRLLTGNTKEYDIIFKQTLSKLQAAKLTGEALTRISTNAELIKGFQDRTVLGFYQSQTNRLKTHLASGLIGGENFRDVVLKFGQGIVTEQNPIATWHFFTDANVGTVINTGYADFSRTMTADAFIDQPGQKFQYVGGTIPTSSEQCRWLIENQRPDGYTKEEIDAGISTPAGLIDFFGRSPNFNCIHSFEAID